MRAYDVRTVIDALCDTGSVLELRRGFGLGMITALARIEGRPVGIVANNPTHLGGAIDTPGADKAARFLQLCDAFDMPVLFLCDTPGFMVGPESEATGAVRHVSRMFVTGANLTVPFATIILRKGYGLGAQAMAGGSFKAPLFCIAWPTGEFGGMNLEGAVRLGQRRELEAIEDPDERERAFQAMVERMYERGKAINTASHFEIDDVIDPADSRRWITTMLAAAPDPPTRDGQEAPQHRHLVDANWCGMSEFASTYDALAPRYDAWSGAIMPDVRAGVGPPDRGGASTTASGSSSSDAAPACRSRSGSRRATSTPASTRRRACSPKRAGTCPTATFVHADMETVTFDAGLARRGDRVLFDHPRARVSGTRRCSPRSRRGCDRAACSSRACTAATTPTTSSPTGSARARCAGPASTATRTSRWSPRPGSRSTESEVIDQVEPDGSVDPPPLARRPQTPLRPRTGVSCGVQPPAHAGSIVMTMGRHLGPISK